MYSGCVICEVRNYRGPHLLQREGLPMYDSNLVLLKPTAEVSCKYIYNILCGSEIYMHYINLPTRESIKTLPEGHI